jgi:hypothetical protein
MTSLDIGHFLPVCLNQTNGSRITGLGTNTNTGTRKKHDFSLTSSIHLNEESAPLHRGLDAIFNPRAKGAGLNSDSYGS